jgi:hypothetical protein
MRRRRPATAARSTFTQQTGFMGFHLDEAEVGDGTFCLHQTIDAFSMPAHVVTLNILLKFLVIKVF